MLILTIGTRFFNFCIKIQRIFGNFTHIRTVRKFILIIHGHYEKYIAIRLRAYYNIAALHPQG